MVRLVLASGLVLAGCASAPAVLAPADHPASPTLATTHAVAATPLPPAEEPTPPPALRHPEAAPAMHSGMGHDRHAAVSAPEAGASTLADALEAYLALHDALASDRGDGLDALAGRFAETFAVAVEVPPEDDPHFWHRRRAETAAVVDAARALAEASGIEEARAAFAALSLPFADLIEAAGVPEGVARYTCGMRSDLPGDGVWLQRGDTPRNPYFGSSMLMCARRDAPASGAEPNHDGHGTH